MRAGSWPEVRIGELGEVFTGRTPSSGYPAYFGGDFPFITPGDMRQGKHARTTERSLSAEGATLLKRITLPAQSICVSCIGWQMGEVIMTDRPSFTNQQINTIVPNDNVEPLFIYYSLRPRKQELLALGTMAGVRTPILNKSAFCDLEIQLPPLTVQQRIASILSAYDELIENSQQRIKILESMARLLYREWFVHFRFPGHESVSLVPSSLGDIPQGWEVKNLGSLADIKWGDTSTTKESYVEKGYAAYSASGLDGQLDHYDFDRMGIVLSAIGAQCGKTWLASGKWSCIKNTIRFWAKNECVSTEFLFIATEGQDFWPRRGAAQPFISQGDAEKIDVLIPDRATMERFTTFVADSLKHIATFTIQIQNLRRTRDLLLPRLLSGQINVEAIAS